MNADPKNLDTREYKAQVWDLEYATRHEVPSSNTDYPSKLVVRLPEIIPGGIQGRVLDVGTGTGRNIKYILNTGASTALGIDFSSEALKLAQQKIEDAGLQERVELKQQSAGDTIEEPDESFNLILDMMTLHALTKDDREKYIEQVIRLLKPGGHFALNTMAYIGDENDQAKKLIEEWEGPEKGMSYRFKSGDNVITERVFTRAELEEMFAPLEVVFFEEKEHETHAFGGVYLRTYYSMVFRKNL